MTSIITDLNKMFCCVPGCGTNRWKRSETSLTFHEFPTGNPKLCSKWIQKINSGTKPKNKPMWFPRGKSVICSKHFQPTDYNKLGSLKPLAVPTIFSINLVDLDKPLSGLKASPITPTQSPSLGIKMNSACSSTNSQPFKISGATVKQIAIKNILNRASDLFAKNMAINKRLENTKLKSPANENECSEVESTTPSNSLPDLNLDQALSLATLQTKQCNLSENSKQKTVLGRPQSANRSLNCNNKAFNSDSSVSKSSSDSVGNKTSIVPEVSLLKSKSQKRKHKGGSKSELIKIGPNKFLKIQRLNAKENTPSTNTVPNSVPKDTSANNQSEDDDVVMDDSFIDDANDNSNDYEPPAAPETHTTCNATVNSTIESSAMKQPVSLTTTMPLGQSPTEPLNCGDPTLIKKPSLKPESAFLQKAKSTAIQSVLNKQPVLFTTNMHFSQSLSKPVIQGNPKPTKKLSLKQENDLLKKKIADLEKICSMRIDKSWSEPKTVKLKKKIEELETKIREQQKELEAPIQYRLKNIRNESSKGNVYATYLLELIDGFGNAYRAPRWSDSTLLQCAHLCRKNAFAYELFRKADFFKLPPFSSVEKFMRRNPNLCLTSQDSPVRSGDKSCNVGKNISSPSTSGIVYKKPKNFTTALPKHMNCSQNHTTDTSNHETQIQANAQPSESVEVATIPVTVDTSSSELREIILESGEVVQCYSTNICTGEDGYQYYIIPGDNVEEGQNVSIQSAENTQGLSEQIVYTHNSSNQLQCSETEVTTAIEMITEKEP